MKLHKYLFRTADDDNVATALANLRAGETVPVITPEGTQVGEITLRAHVPIFFKVALIELRDGEIVRKWGHEIGQVLSRVYYPNRDPDADAQPAPVVQPGMPVHVGNFIPSREILAFWGGDMAHAANVIVEKHGSHSQFAPYELGAAKKNIARGQEIRSADIHLPGLRSLLPPSRPDLVVGIADDDIAKETRFRLGCCKGGDFLFPGEAENVDVIQKFYRFLKGRFYEIA